MMLTMASSVFLAYNDMLTLNTTETTVIVLADWYHTVAPSLFPNPGDVDPLVYRDSSVMVWIDVLL